MGSKKPLISVIIPHFNREEEITVALKGVVDQKYDNWECLIIDDGSHEKSKQKLKSHIRKLHTGKILYYERSKNRKKGANACRNVGMELARGEYVAFLDSDDSWPESYLLEAVKFAESRKIFHASYSGATVLRNNKIGEIKSRPKDDEEGFFDFLLSPGVLAQTSSYFLRRKIALDIKFDEQLKRHQDYDFFIRLGQKYNWNYNPNCSTFINWSTIQTRRVDFESCIVVYNRHKYEFKNKHLKSGYLVSQLGMSLREDAHPKIVQFYSRELNDTGYKKEMGLILLVNFPYVFKFYKKLLIRLSSTFNF